jgi:AcrR family transcriptional regulator
MSSSKNRILDAAEQIVFRLGAAHLTIDAVAAEAAMSKGGVLYHFPTKEDLIRGMIWRLIQVYEAEVARLEALDPCPKGRKLRAMLGASFRPVEAQFRCDRLAAALLAAVATNPALLQPVREHSDAMHAALLEDGIEPDLAAVIHLAAEGLWLTGLLETLGMDAPKRERIVQKLYSLTSAEMP